MGKSLVFTAVTFAAVYMLDMVAITVAIAITATIFSRIVDEARLLEKRNTD